jgi:hypothetical protein
MYLRPTPDVITTEVLVIKTEHTSHSKNFDRLKLGDWFQTTKSLTVTEIQGVQYRARDQRLDTEYTICTLLSVLGFTSVHCCGALALLRQFQIIATKLPRLYILDRLYYSGTLIGSVN